MSATSLIEIIRKEIMKTYRTQFSGFELATVVSPCPELAIRVDNMKIELTKQDLILCERLASSVRVVSLKSDPGVERQLERGTGKDENSISKNIGTLTAITNTIDGHSHTLQELNLKDFALELVNVELKCEDGLKRGDRVLVQAVPGGQKYMIIDRVVEYA